MKNRIINISFLIIISILILEDIISIPCPFHFITGLYCPGCGITRMIKSILKLDFYQAFRYNQLLFILLPFFIIIIIDLFISIIIKKKSIYKKIPEYVWIIIVIILIIFGIIRNIIPFFAPTTI